MSRLGQTWSWVRPRWEALVAIALLAISLAVIFKLALLIDRPLVDDALISIGYARSFVDGDGFRPTPYSQVSEGFSNPTWTLVLAVFEKLHINSMWPAKTFGMILAALSLPLTFLWGPLSQQRKVELQDAIAPLFACSNATIVYWSLGGLETGILVFLSALFGVLVFMPRTRRVAIALGFAAAALSLVRPEGPIYVAAAGIPWLLDWAIRTRVKPTKNDWIALGAYLVPLAIYIFSRRLYFGSWLPNTYYAKQSWFIGATNIKENTDAYLKTFTDAISLLITAGVIGVVASLFGGMRTAKTAIASALIAGAMIFFGWYAHADWMKEWRFLSPTIPFICYPISAGATAMRRFFERPFLKKHSLIRSAGHAIVIASVLSTLYSTTKKHMSRWVEVKLVGGDTPRKAEDRKEYGQDLRDLIAPLQMTHPFIGGPDMGWMSVGLREAELLDTAGLTDVAIARHYGNQNAVRDYLVNEGLPTIMMVWGPSGYLHSMQDILSQYHSGPRQYAAYMIYTKATAESDERCPNGKPSAMQDDTEQMVQNMRGQLEAHAAIKALAMWRCYLTYRKDADLPTRHQRAELSDTAESMAKQEMQNKEWERALRDYSFCAVIGGGASCRMRAEHIRGRMYPRPAPPKPRGAK